ncbi:hypothetical protein MAR_019784 [Mya arenaria]|uniref:Uncharacterized protein n=1 Tax=Mya arenaria TaxID=6604 RepID=A0ABY7E331_MYAAR|nr:hypothetical protein MAR_019784 [Mya arenaria]
MVICDVIPVAIAIARIPAAHELELTPVLSPVKHVHPTRLEIALHELIPLGAVVDGKRQGTPSVKIDHCLDVAAAEGGLHQSGPLNNENVGTSVEIEHLSHMNATEYRACQPGTWHRAPKCLLLLARAGSTSLLRGSRAIAPPESQTDARHEDNRKRHASYTDNRKSIQLLHSRKRNAKLRSAVRIAKLLFASYKADMIDTKFTSSSIIAN